MHRLTPIMTLLMLAASLFAGVPLRWSVETSARPRPFDVPIFRGETVSLSASLLSYGAPVDLTDAQCVFYWQTNGMHSAWWTLPGTATSNRLDFTWQPSCDVGAENYTFFLAATNAAGRNYRAHGRIRMIGSPGDSASGIHPDPTSVWDTRYDRAGTAQSYSNALAAALQDETQARIAGDADSLSTTWAETGRVAYAGLANVSMLANNADYARIAGSLSGTTPDGQALAAATDHITDPAAHPDIRQAIDAIPLPPTNVVSGWLVWDAGSNCYWRVSATNLRFYIWSTP